MKPGKRGFGYFIAFFLLISSSSLAQDILVRTNNDSIRVKIVEMTGEKIRFRYPGMKTGPVKEIPKNQIKSVIYENGTTITIIYNPYEVSRDLTVPDKKHAIKGDLIAPFMNHVTLGYEQSLKLGLNLELKAGIIGMRLNEDLKYSEGFLVKAGLKFVKCTEGIWKGLKYKDPLKGSYFRPELIFSSFKTFEKNNTIQYNHYTVNIAFGRQTVIKRLFLFDWYGSIGTGFKTTSYTQKSEYDSKEVDFNYAYSHLFFGKKLPLVLSGGISIGMVF
ncbi:MAG TPA: hypothetical protein PLU53_08415 [Bacteroidia bacterium]|nr:hypothetical protein [Bacteroidia bacterium]